VTVLRRAYVEVEPDVTGFDTSLKAKLQAQDPGGKAGKQVGGQLNRALKRFDLAPIDIKADPKSALAGIAVAEAKLRELSGQAATVEVKIQTDKALGQLARFRKQIGTVAEDAGPEAAAGFAARFSARLGPLIAGLPISGPMGAALGAAAISAAPLIGAAVAGGIIGGAGIGGVVGGLALAAKDARVKAAADGLGDRLEQRLNRAGGAFVGPALQGLAQVEKALADIDLEGIFEDSAKFVQPLATGVTTAVTALGGALRELIANADGPVQEIADGIAQIGVAAANGMRSLADNGKEGADALRTIFALITSGIQTTFLLVNALTELYEINKRIGGDVLLQSALKLTGATMDANTFSARRTAEATTDLSGASIQAAKSAEQLKLEQEELKAAQQGLTTAQDALSRSLDSLGGKNTLASRTADTLRTAMDNLYGAGIRNTDANEAYQASWDDLSASVKANKNTLDINSAAGRSNRDVLQSLLLKNNDLYLANIAAGTSIDSARKKHQNRTEAIKEEARRLGLNEEATKDLISTYGKIPKKKQTDLLIGKIGGVVKALENLYISQRAIAEGIPLASARAAVKEKGGPAKQFGGYAQGGLFDGRLPGPPSRVDNLQGVGPDGKAFGLAGGEFIVNAPQTSKYRDVLEAINAGRDGYATGGYFPPVDTSTRIPFRTDLSKAYVMSLADARSRVTPAIPSGGRTSDFIVAAAKALVPGIQVLSKDRPGARTLSGNVSYHSLGRAVDFAPSEKLARLWNERYKATTKELISPYQQHNLRNGQRHTYTGAVWRQHNFAGRNAHDHIAMDDGGFRTLRPGMNLIPNGTGRPELIGGPAALAAMAGNTYQITVNVPPTAHPAEVGKQLVSAIQSFEASNGARWRR
jgi:hypothetical protein